MKNNKGQALVEFVIILPILLLVIISIIDFGNIIIKKYSLENDLDIIVDMYNEENYDDINAYVSNKNITINYDSKDEFLTISVSKNINISSLIMYAVVGKNYNVTASRVVYENK